MQPYHGNFLRSGVPVAPLIEQILLLVVVLVLLMLLTMWLPGIRSATLSRRRSVEVVLDGVIMVASALFIVLYTM